MDITDKILNNDSLNDIGETIINKSEDAINTVEDITETTSTYIKDKTKDILSVASALGSKLKEVGATALEKTKTEATNIYKISVSTFNETRIKGNEKIESEGSGTVSTASKKLFNVVDSALTSVQEVAETYIEYIPTTSVLGTALKSIATVITRGLNNYNDGVSETSFGEMMADSWHGNTSSFLDYFKNENKKSTGSYKINILKSTPLDAGDTRNSVFGNLILGCPFLFNSMADPNNRSLINSFVKDARYLSLTPGMPKYNSINYTQTTKNNILKQTESPTDMIAYLLRNGIDKSFADKDKRYYTFQTKYKEYFSYLETMLNPIWIKMGLGTDDNGKFNIFSFFKLRTGDIDGGIDPSGYDELLPQYNSSIGFYVNPSSAVAESVSNSQTGFGAELAGRVNNNSDEYQRINYITGMGTGSLVQNVSRKTAYGLQTAKSLGNYFADNFTSAQYLKSSFANATSGRLKSTLAGIAGFALGAALDVTRLSATEDFGSLIQSYAVSNGMRVVYPELWSNSDYSKSMNLNLSFVSPYGDPLSIFKYVYVPFCALLCFALPRQAAENGFVSPFFVRADIPGLFTTDLGLISDITWTKGGSNNLWTKDGLPRAIDVSITLTDLYPYLAMTRRMSFLSANPSYTVFLDNMAGMCALNDDSEDDSLNAYFRELINRVNGETDKGNQLWNKFNSTQRKANYNFANTKRGSMSSGIDTVPWMHNSKLN